MKRFLPTLLFLAILGAVFYLFRGSLRDRTLPLWDTLKSEILGQAAPCAKPIPYKIASFDERFGISRDDFAEALSEAEAVWEKPSGRDLFVYAPDDEAENDLKVNLIYDYREQATEKLSDLGITVKNTRASYDALKAKLDDLKADYDKDKVKFDADVAAFNKKKDDYDAEVTYWNGQGGAPEDKYDELRAEHDELQTESDAIDKEETDLNAEVDEINSLVVSINGIAKSLNLSVEQYNTVSGSRGDSFEEGVYETDGLTRTINIYEFSSKDKLVRVLAHELGHALGLEHVDDPKAIMYKLNEGTNAAADQTDLDALAALCGSR